MARIKNIPSPTPFKERLSLEVMRLKEEANKLPPGPLRDAMIRKARQTATASHVDGWLSSAGLKAPIR